MSNIQSKSIKSILLTKIRLQFSTLNCSTKGELIGRAILEQTKGNYDAVLEAFTEVPKLATEQMCSLSAK